MLKKLQFQLFLTLGFWLSAMVSGIAQTFPVTISTQITQPSPIYLNNYADATTINSPIKVQIALNDLTISNRQIRLKCYFQGQSISLMTNDFVVGSRDLFLEGGVPLQLTNVDLAPYFEYQNLLGVNPNQYAQALPEGIYTFSVEVYDFATNKKLSKKTSVTTIIFQNDPPFLNLPLNNASIMQQNIQNIIFSWTPRQINVSNVEYEFSLVEIWDKYTPVQNAFAYSPPLYTTTTRSTTLQYGVSEPQLLPGKKYAWRVKAKALLGAEEVGVFKNNGYSEIFSFTYETYCTAPLAITTTNISQDQAKITWSGDIDNFDYQVNYREKNADSDWYKIVTPREFATISNLKPNATYEYTVGASCEVGKYTHSTIQEFTTMAKDEIAFVGCGIKPDPADLANKNPLPELFANDVVKAGDFPIVVLHSSGSNGKFSGDGYVTLPFLEKFRTLIDAANAAGGPDIGKYSRIRITFDNIGVNTDFKLISGEIIASYDPTWSNMADGDKILTDILGSDGKPIEGKLDYVVKSATLNPDGSTTIIGENGAKTTLPKSPYDQVYTDKNGTTVTIPANGSAAPTIGAPAPGGKATASNTNGMSSSGEVAQISSPDVKITFEDSKEAKYAFDPQPENGSAKLKSSYELIPTGDGKVYKVNYKAVSDLKGDDYVIARAEFSNGKKSSDIVFKTSSGGKVDAEWNTSDNTAKILLKKTLNFGKDAIIATVKGAPVKSVQDTTKTVEGKSDVAGKLNVWHLTKKTPISVTLLGINGAKTPDNADAAKFLNDVYNKAGIEFTVISQNVKINDLPSEIESGNSDLLNVYTDGQIDIISQIEANTDFKYNDKTYYVLYTGKSGQNGYDGFMPLGGQYAFVFNNGNLKTAAHELGHGIFGLKHPFSTEAESGKTNLLMDYGNGTVLSHNDWDIIHSGGWKFYGFQKSSSGALAGGYGISPMFEFVKTQLTSVYSGDYIADDGFTSGFSDLLDKEIVNYVWDDKKHEYVYIHELNGIEKREIHAVTKTVTGNPWIWLFANNKGECNVDKKYIRTKYENIKSFISSGNTAGLQRYIKSILDDKFKKEGVNDFRDQVWGILNCTSDKGTTGGTGTDIAYKDYLGGLGKQSNKGYKPDATNVNAQENHTYDYSGVISEKEKLKIISQMKNISTESGLIAKIFITDVKTLPEKKKEVSDYLANLSGSQVAVWIDFNANGEATVKTIIGSAVNGSGNGDVNKFLAIVSAVIPKFDGTYNYFNPLTAILDGIASIVTKAKIPERFYNPEITTNDYNPILYYAGLVDPFAWSALLGDQMLQQNNITITNSKLVKISHVHFAFKCGVWNGLVDQVKGLAEMTAIVTNLIDGGDRAGEMWEGIKKLDIWCTESKDGNVCIWSLVKKSHTGQTCQIAETVGYDVANIITIAISFAKVGKVAQIAKVIESLDMVSQTMKLAGKLIKITVKGTGTAARFSFAVSKAFIAPGLKFAKLNKTYCALFPIAIDLTENVDNAVSKAKELLKKSPADFEKAVTILTEPDVDGNVIAEIVENGEKIKILLNESEDKLRKSASEIVEDAGEAIVARLKKLGLVEDDIKNALEKIGSSPTDSSKLLEILEKAPFKDDLSKLKDLLKDITASTDLQDFVKQGKDFTKEWLILEAYPSFRKLGVHIDKISSILAKGHVSVDDLTTILTVNKGLGKRATDLTNFLNDLDHFALYARQDGFGSIISGLKAHWFNGAGADGANWVIAVIRKEGDNVFVPSRTNFEVSALANTRRYDAIVGETGNKSAKYFEFKSYSKVPPTDFAKQFLGDLSNGDIVDLKQLQWLFDAGKNPPDFASNMKKAIDNLEITDDMAKKFLKDVENPTASKLKKYLKEDFDEIFKLK
ncbi:fibronectin type III domain-containing protein [Flavobacterium sp. S87F.05.LMB.W.Kidney.N]|uniref:fibronectin type III domain-containing protein n=1 Tax=Flavobacterium sp. S87F.05.LMB.W.Kidney.N TaxID=1278758 RepID=UPI001066CFC9|nr:fibronectin type III domain-containing protein [Flavobacterium sp. S87F.05.LMB.W.Kidney.N]TDX11690.1 vacuolar-type H+-ATPase subunit E/Vma4 [Flavobacterium sp. S87F.05.LMB.W.Kidney.N]